MGGAIHHVQLAMPAGGEEQARRFYVDLLGFRELEKPPNLRARGGLWLATDNLQLHLGVDPIFRPATKAHVALQFANIPALRQRLEAAGCQTSDDEPLAGYRRFYVADPFGKRTEILEPEPPPA